MLSVCKFLNRKKNTVRILLGSAAASVCSLIILLPPQGDLLNFLIKLTVSCLICLIAFKFGSLKDFVKNTAAFYLFSFLFCGVMLAIWFTFTPQGMVINNNAVYFNISPLCLIISSLITYFVVGVICRITGQKKPKELYYDVIIERGSKQAKIKGKLDTGCSLVEPFSGSPVIICNKGLIKDILPKGVLEYDMCQTYSSSPVPGGIRVAPFGTISGTGLLPCFKPDRIFIGDSLCLNEIYIAAADKNKISCGCLINPQCLD